MQQINTSFEFTEAAIGRGVVNSNTAVPFRKTVQHLEVAIFIFY